MHGTAFSLVIRREVPNDIDAIDGLTKRAFHGKAYSGGDEQDLIAALRAAGALTLSLVAEEAGVIIGHVAISPAFAEDGSKGWHALGPISVAPDRQRNGIGGRLIKDSMSHLVAMKARGCILIGDTNYYPRHGFVPRADLAPEGEPADHFMVLSLNGQQPETIVSFHPVLQSAGTT